MRTLWTAICVANLHQHPNGNLGWVPGVFRLTRMAVSSLMEGALHSWSVCAPWERSKSKGLRAPEQGMELTLYFKGQCKPQGTHGETGKQTVFAQSWGRCCEQLEGGNIYSGWCITPSVRPEKWLFLVLWSGMILWFSVLTHPRARRAGCSHSRGHLVNVPGTPSPRLLCSNPPH